MSVRFGIIGLGGIANRFASALTKAKGVSLEAVASKDVQRAQEFSAKHHPRKVHATYEALIADKEVDVIYVATTHNFHFELVKNCLEAKKAVLCEKPLVTTAEEAAQLIALSKTNNVLLMEAMWSRCLPAFQKAKEWVDQGLIGPVSYVNASFSFPMPFMPEHRLFNKSLAGGSLYDAGVYPIEFALGIVGEAPGTTKGVASICATGVDDFVAMSLSFPSGAVANLSCGFKAMTNLDAGVYGPAGRIVVHEFLQSRRCERFDNKGTLLETFDDPEDDGFVHEVHHAAELFRTGMTESPLIPHRDTLACAKIFDILMGQFPSA